MMKFLLKNDAEEEEEKATAYEEKYYLASQWQLMWRKFRKHKLAMGGISVLIVLY